MQRPARASDHDGQRLQAILTHVQPGLPLLCEQTVLARGGTLAGGDDSPSCDRTPTTRSSRPRIAAIVTTCFPRSHGDVILTKLIKGMSLDEKFARPRVDIVSLWIDCIAATSP